MSESKTHQTAVIYRRGLSGRDVTVTLTCGHRWWNRDSAAAVDGTRLVTRLRINHDFGKLGRKTLERIPSFQSFATVCLQILQLLKDTTAASFANDAEPNLPLFAA